MIKCTALLLLIYQTSCAQPDSAVVRIGDAPIITADLFEGEAGENINGPSLIKVPDFVRNPLGKYYLYFAHHHGQHIRMAYADRVEGPYTLYEPGTLPLEDCTPCNTIPPEAPERFIPHVASPDVHIDAASQQLVMYFHCPVYLGGDTTDQKSYRQMTFRSTSDNGLDFVPEEDALGVSYFRVFRWKDHDYAIARLGQMYRSKDGKTDFEEGGNPFSTSDEPSRLRHAAVTVDRDTLWVFYTRIGDAPEGMLLSHIPLTDDWRSWQASPPDTVLQPERPYEGGHLLARPSERGAIYMPVRQLRDPALLIEEDKAYLLYAVQGEKAIALAAWRRHGAK